MEYESLGASEPNGEHYRSCRVTGTQVLWCRRRKRFGFHRPELVPTAHKVAQYLHRIALKLRRIGEDLPVTVPPRTLPEELLVLAAIPSF